MQSGKAAKTSETDESRVRDVVKESSAATDTDSPPIARRVVTRLAAGTVINMANINPTTTYDQRCSDRPCNSSGLLDDGDDDGVEVRQPSRESQAWSRGFSSAKLTSGHFGSHCNGSQNFALLLCSCSVGTFVRVLGRGPTRAFSPERGKRSAQSPSLPKLLHVDP